MGAQEVMINGAHPPNLPQLYPTGDLLPKCQAECRYPSKFPFRAPVRNAAHSDWVNDNTGPVRSLEFRTSTNRPSKATSTQSVACDASLFRHSILFHPDSAIRLSFDQAKNYAVGCPTVCAVNVHGGGTG
jgi:hypothetical protein